MIYVFACAKCNLEKEVFRFVKDCSEPETCDMCGKVMRREYTVHNIKVDHSYFNEGLGIKVSNKSDIRDHLNKVKDSTGNEIIELGNEKQNTTRKQSSYKLTKDEYQHVEAILKRDS